MITYKELKKIRRHQGTINGLMIALIRSGIPTVKAFHAVQDLLDEYHVRALEKTTSRNLYDFVAGFVESYRNQTSIAQEFVLTK